MTENMKKFIEEARSNPPLRTQLAQLEETEEKSGLTARVIEIAKEHGFVLTAEDFEEDVRPLDDDELAGIAAAGGCGCIAIGGGGGDGIDGACVCAVSGTSFADPEDTDLECYCAIVGAGWT